MSIGVCAVIILAAGFLYAPVAGFDYVWDDSALFVDNDSLRQGAFTWDLLIRPILSGTSYIRPAVIASFIAEFRWFGISPAVSHTINLSLFLMNIALVAMLAFTHSSRRALSNAGLRAALCAAVYAFHPMMVEATCWISGRFDLMATLFVLIALLADLVIRRPLLRAAAVSTAFALAIGSKEVAFCVPVLLVLQRLALEPAKGGIAADVRSFLLEHKYTVILCGLVFCVAVLIRLGLTARLVPPTTVGDVLSSRTMHAVFVFRTAWFYLCQVFSPLGGKSMPIHPAYPDQVFDPLELLRAAGAVLVMAVAAIFALRRNYSGLLVASAISALLPVLNIVVLPMAGNIGCDRFLTLPLAFVSLAISGIRSAQIPGVDPGRSSIVVAVLAVCWIGSSAAYSRVSLKLWRNDFTLWGYLYAQEESKATAAANYVSAALEEGRYEVARDVLEAELKVGALEAGMQTSYGLVLARAGTAEEGIRYIEGALSVYPHVEYADSDWRSVKGADAFVRDRVGYGYFALAEAQLAAGNVPAALSAANEAVRYRPGSISALATRAQAEHLSGMIKESEATFQAALRAAHPLEVDRLSRRRASYLRPALPSPSSTPSG